MRRRQYKIRTARSIFDENDVAGLLGQSIEYFLNIDILSFKILSFNRFSVKDLECGAAFFLGHCDKRMKIE
jgi:hypothetical protein